MKTLHLSKFSIFMIAILAIAFVTFGIVVYSSPSNISHQNERIYLHLDFRDAYNIPKYVKLSDMEPNRMGFFAYPNSYNFSDSANAYQRFILIRLPTWLGGDMDNISSYRAYSMLDLDSHCMIKYWPQEQRQRIEDPCHFEMYRAIDGASYFFGIKGMSKPVENALPQLNLGADSDGYIYVKPPTWTVDKNGLVGDGRHLSKEQILKTSKELLLDYQKTSNSHVPFPLELDDKTFLIDIISSKESAQIRYTSDKVETNNPSIDVTFCNCTGTARDFHQYVMSDNNLQAWQVGPNLIYSSPYDTGPEGMHNYVFQFFENGYEIRVYSHMEFADGVKMILDNFFNGTKLPDIQQVSTGL